MTDVSREKELYEILAQSSLADDRTLVLKQGDTFAVFDRHGDIPSLGPGHHGIYHAGTRFLSRCVLQLEHADLATVFKLAVKAGKLNPG